jgi:hypothetical protein
VGIEKWGFALSWASHTRLWLQVPLLTSSYLLTLLAFCCYELGLGLYWPAIAMLRAELVSASMVDRDTCVCLIGR